MKSRKKRLMFVTLLAAFLLAAIPNVYGMHIMEGYLLPGFCLAWGAVALPFLVWGFFSIQKIVASDRKNVTLLAMAGAFIFVISSLKIPSVTGSCSHMTGTGMGAILFGPGPVAVLGGIVLLFQSMMLAHGGITTLGANLFSMAIAGPILSWLVYKGLKKCKVNSNTCIFFAAFLGDLFTYCVTGMQLAVAYPSAQGGVGVSAVKFLSIFAPTQIPLAVIEGLLTVVVFLVLESYASHEMKLIGFLEREV